MLALKQKWFNSIQQQLIIGFLILTISPLVVFTYLSFQDSASALNKKAVHSLEDNSKLHMSFIKNWFYYRDIDISLFANLDNTVSLMHSLNIGFASQEASADSFVHSQRYKDIIKHYQLDVANRMHYYKYIYDIFFIDLEGNILFTIVHENDFGTNLNSGIYKDTKFAAAYKTSRQSGKKVYSDMERYGASADGLYSFILSPVMQKGRMIGTVAFQIRPERIYDSLKVASDYKQNSFLVAEDGYLRSSMDTNESSILHKRIESTLIKDFMAKKNEAKVETYINSEGVEVIGMYERVTIMGVTWALVSEIDLNDATKDSYILAKKLLLLLALALIITTIASIYIARRLAKPIGELAKQSKDFASGKEVSVHQIRGNNEIENLSLAFHNMMVEIKSQEINLRFKSNEAMMAVEAKSAFLASMSHEIRTPMNGVIGMLELLKKSSLTDRQYHQVSLAESSANSLLTIINDILDFSKIEAGKLMIESYRFDLLEMLSDLIESLAYKAHNKEIELLLDVTALEYSHIISDANRIRQIIVNLVNNAIKFTELGHVIVKVGIENERLYVSVEDSGIGIPAEKLSTLFDAFTQVDSSTTRRYGGTGLGLSIARRLCELMEGSISAESREGFGSTFRFELPITLDEPIKQIVVDKALSGKKVVILSLIQQRIELLQRQLEKWHMRTFACSDESSLFETLHSHEQIDILFIDSDELENEYNSLVEKIRADVNFSHITIINMVPIVSHHNISYYHEKGYDFYFAKPITLRDLLASLEHLHDDTKREECCEIDDTPLYNWPKETKILLVDDNITNQLVTNGMLEMFDLEADVANNGLEALEILQAHDDYTLILMDCQMPEMDGYEATQAIRNAKAGDAYKNIPILAMTANAMEGDKERCIMAGMSDYIAKPIDSAKLLALLEKWLLSKA